MWEYSHGQDSRPVEVPGPRKSVGAQITYGVRLDGEADAQQFLERLAGACATYPNNNPWVHGLTLCARCPDEGLSL